MERYCPKSLEQTFLPDGNQFNIAGFRVLNIARAFLKPPKSPALTGIHNWAKQYGAELSYANMTIILNQCGNHFLSYILNCMTSVSKVIYIIDDTRVL